MPTHGPQADGQAWGKPRSTPNSDRIRGLTEANASINHEYHLIKSQSRLFINLILQKITAVYAKIYVYVLFR